jgi:hypothetical protein
MPEYLDICTDCKNLIKCWPKGLGAFPSNAIEKYTFITSPIDRKEDDNEYYGNEDTFISICNGYPGDDDSEEELTPEPGQEILF